MLRKVGLSIKIICKIDEGDFSSVYRAISIKNNRDLAVKVESTSSQYPQLYYQCKLYMYFLADRTVVDKGIPNIYYCSTEGDYNILVMDLLGPSLEVLFNQCHKRFSLKTVLMIIDQMIQRIQFIHNKKFLHGDIRPENFCIGLDQNSHKIFIIDFGHAKKYDAKYKYAGCRRGQRPKISHSLRYASIKGLLGQEQTKMDQLESIGYVAIYFLRGSLPWQGLKAYSKRDKYERIKEKKMKTSIEDLCNGYPEEFANLFRHRRDIPHNQKNQKPDYAAMRGMFKQLSLKNSFEYDYQYDWVILAEENHKNQTNNDYKKMS